MNNIMRTPVVTEFKRNNDFNNEEMIIKYRETNDPKIREEIIINNIPLVMHIMKDYAFIKNIKSYYPDLIGVAYLALIESIDKYEIEKAKFSTYVVVAIKNRVDRERQILEGENSAVRYGKKIAMYRYMATKIFGTSDVIYDQENMDYIFSIMLEKKTINKSDILPMSLTLHSISKLYTDEDIENVAEEEDTSSSEPIDFIRTYRDELFEGFSDYEKELIEYRYGFIDGKEHSLQEVGEYFGKTKQAISRRELKLLEKMRRRGNKYR